MKNIIELVNSIACLALYPMSDEECNDDDISKDGGAILRCETCFVLCKVKAKKLTPCRATAELSTDCTTICTGKYLSPDVMSLMMAVSAC